LKISVPSSQPGGGAKGAEALPLAKSNVRKKIKYRIVLIFFCLSGLKLHDFANLWSYKIDYDPEKLRKVTYDIIFMTS